MRFIKFSFLQYFAIFISIVINFFLAKYTSKSDYGVFSLGLVFFNIVIGLADYGLERNGLIRLNKVPESVRSEFVTQFIVRFFSILFVGFVLSSYVYFGGYSNILYLYIFATVIVSLIPKFFFDYNQAFVRESVFLIIDRIVFLMLLCLFWYLDSLTCLNIALSYFLGRLIYFIFSFFYVISSLKLRRIVFNRGLYYDIRELLKNNFVFWVINIFNISIIYVNQLVLTSDSGIGVLAVFSFAMQFISILRILQNQYLRWNVPSLSEAISSEALNLNKINKILFKSFIFSAVASFTLYFVARFIIYNYYQDFTGSVLVLLILCFWSIIYGPGLINSFILSNRIKPKLFFVISVSFSLMSLLANYLLKSNVIVTALCIVIPHCISMFVQYYLIFNLFRDDRIKK